jgi:hypothetical protein
MHCIRQQWEANMPVDNQLDDIVIVGLKTADGERFLVGTKEASPPEIAPTIVSALAAANLVPYEPVRESVMRSGLLELGLTAPEVDARFLEARRWMATVATSSYREH